MSFNGDNKEAVTVPDFPVKVLGGTFHVHALMVEADQTREDVVAAIHAVPADRWFVMVSDDAADGADSLAMIDDALEFQIYAHGVLRQD